eukprot:scaffold10229_cov116-Isochrysis_galbana.AAC.8
MAPRMPGTALRCAMDILPRQGEVCPMTLSQQGTGAAAASTPRPRPQRAVCAARAVSCRPQLRRWRRRRSAKGAPPPAIAPIAGRSARHGAPGPACARWRAERRGSPTRRRRAAAAIVSHVGRPRKNSCPVPPSPAALLLGTPPPAVQLARDGLGGPCAAAPHAMRGRLAPCPARAPEAGGVPRCPAAL